MADIEDLFHLGGKVAVVTGASSGLGRRAATVLAQAGAGRALLVADLPAPDPARLSTQAEDFRRI